jgi:hypothetical protein
LPQLVQCRWADPLPVCGRGRGAVRDWSCRFGSRDGWRRVVRPR